MECEEARRSMEEREPDEPLAAHLAECAACRAEAAFGRRIATAVAALPQQRAPSALLNRVMSAAREETTRREPVATPQLSLRPWELWGLAAATVTLLALLPIVWSTWPLPRTPDTSWDVVWNWATATLWTAQSDTQAAWRDLCEWLTGVWPDLDARAPVWHDEWTSWVSGAAAFATALYLLLSWRSRDRTEDAHA